MMDQKKRQRGGDALSLAATARYGGTFIILKLLASVGNRRRMFHKQRLTLDDPHQFCQRQARE